MKKIRVIREMPKMKVGEEIENAEVFFVSTDYLIKNGWIEYVEEPKSLEQKLKDIYETETGQYIYSPNFISVLALKHFLEIFDRTVEDNIFRAMSFSKSLMIIRQALERG